MVRSVGVWGKDCPDSGSSQSRGPATGCPRWSAWTEQGLHPQKPRLIAPHCFDLLYLVPVTRHRHGCPPSEAHGYLMSPLILCSTLRICHNLLWCLAKEFHGIHRRLQPLPSNLRSLQTFPSFSTVNPGHVSENAD